MQTNELIRSTNSQRSCQQVSFCLFVDWPWNEGKESSFFCRSVIDHDIWDNSPYLIWAIFTPFFPREVDDSAWHSRMRAASFFYFPNHHFRFCFDDSERDRMRESRQGKKSVPVAAAVLELSNERYSTSLYVSQSVWVICGAFSLASYLGNRWTERKKERQWRKAKRRGKAGMGWTWVGDPSCPRISEIVWDQLRDIWWEKKSIGTVVGSFRSILKLVSDHWCS